VRGFTNHIRFHEYADIEIVRGECRHSFPAHIHEIWCVGLITGGRAEFTMNGRKTALSAGEYYVIPPYTAHALSSVAFETFRYRVVCFKNTEARGGFEGAAAKAKAYIEASASEFNLDALAEAAHVSKYHLDRVFKERVGITPHQFYTGVRIKKIRQGLQANVPLSDMVFDLNFFDQSHLGNTFRKHVGIAPMEYARSYRYG
jgi:AraC-like DNA-binding protein